MMKVISLVALACLFSGFGEFASAKEDSPHFFGKIARLEASFQKVALEEPACRQAGIFSASDSLRLFERKKFPAKRLFGKKLDLSFLFDSIIPVKRLFSLSGVKRIHINLDIDVVFKDEND